MRHNEVKPYSESYQYLWNHRENYQEFRFNVMNMWVPDETHEKILFEECEKVLKEADKIAFEKFQKLEDLLKETLKQACDYETKMETKITEVNKILDEYLGNQPLHLAPKDHWIVLDGEGIKRLREALK